MLAGVMMCALLAVSQWSSTTAAAQTDGIYQACAATAGTYFIALVQYCMHK